LATTLSLSPNAVVRLTAAGLTFETANRLALFVFANATLLNATTPLPKITEIKAVESRIRLKGCMIVLPSINNMRFHSLDVEYGKSNAGRPITLLHVFVTL